MTADATGLSFNARFDRDRSWWRGDSYRYLVVEIGACAGTDAGEPRPHHVAIGICASPAFAGARLDKAKNLAIGIIGRLQAMDTIAVVSFAGDAKVELAPTAADGTGKRAAVSAVRRLEARNGSDLFEGWLTTAEQAALALEKRPGAHAMALLLSDGRAVSGLRNPEELARHSSALRSRGITTTSVAVGNDCDLSLLIALDDPAGLRRDFTVTPTNAADDLVAAVDAFVANHFEFSPIVASDVRLAVRASLGLSDLTPIGGESFKRDGQRLICRLDDFRGASHRTVVVRARLPEGEVGSGADFTTELSWTDAAGQRRRSGRIVRRLTFVRGRDNSAQPRDPESAMAVLKRWQLTLLQEIIRLNQEGKVDDAETHLAQELKYIERYAEGLPEAAGLIVKELKLALPMVHAPWRERQSLGVQGRP